VLSVSVSSSGVIGGLPSTTERVRLFTADGSVLAIGAGT
jgi:hypothetical protein